MVAALLPDPHQRPIRGSNRAQDNVCELVERAFDLGINYFDTAPIYGGTLCEEFLGNALTNVSRPFYLATKVGFDPEDFDYRRDSVLWSLDRSLTRLRVPKLSVAQFHDNQASLEPSGLKRAVE